MTEAFHQEWRANSENATHEQRAQNNFQRVGRDGTITDLPDARVGRIEAVIFSDRVDRSDALRDVPEARIQRRASRSVAFRHLRFHGGFAIDEISIIDIESPKARVEFGLQLPVEFLELAAQRE